MSPIQLLSILIATALMLWPAGLSAADKGRPSLNSPNELATHPPIKLEMAGAKIEIIFSPGKLELPMNKIKGWIKKSAAIVATFYGRFPVNSLRVHIVPTPGEGVRGGQAFGHDGAFIRLPLGIRTKQKHLDQDWVAIHEMIHLALPRVARRHLWLSEGLAVYLESLARVQAGDIGEKQVWKDFIRDMPKGLPRYDDRGLDNTPTWGRRYWGGALFCLLADIKIRQKTDKTTGLQAAMRGVLNAGGNFEVFWPISKIIKTADRTVNTDVLEKLYREMATKPVSPDLDKLWKSLGISQSGGEILFDNQAPLASIRRAIFHPPAHLHPGQSEVP